MFTIGEFSRFAQVTPDLLRHYDHIGLFKPAHINEQTGYRYYHAEQLPDLNRILSLKDLGLSLQQIQQMMADNITIDEIRGMLKHQRLMTEETIRQEWVRLQKIEARLQHLEQEASSPAYEITEKSTPSRAWLSIEKATFPDLENGAFFSKVYRACAQVITRDEVVCVCAMNGVDINTDDWRMGITLPKHNKEVKAIVPSLALEATTLPAHDTVASVVYNGRLGDYYRAYNALAIWIDDYGYQMAGGVYEWVYQLERPADGIERSTVEIQIPLVC
ncbi:MAG: MerR family transcriptional regulator [Chloroflexota bacterium]